MLYEILKVSKLGAAAAPDMFTGLLAAQMPFAKGGKIVELSGVPPLSFLSNGKPLLDWRIKSNAVQSVTPTPDTPVILQGVGVLDGNNWKIPITCGGQTTNVNLAEVQSIRQIKKLVFDGGENWQKSVTYGGSFFCCIDRYFD